MLAILLNLFTFNQRAVKLDVYSAWVAQWFADQRFHSESLGAGFCKDFAIVDEALTKMSMGDATGRIVRKYVH